jgi:hypothetical protein
VSLVIFVTFVEGRVPLRAQARAGRTNTARLSTWGVLGKKSNARRPSSLYPASIRRIARHVDETARRHPEDGIGRFLRQAGARWIEHERRGPARTRPLRPGSGARTRREVGLDAADVRLETRCVGAGILAKIGAAHTISFHRRDLQPSERRERDCKEADAGVQVHDLACVRDGVGDGEHQRPEKVAIPLEEG